MTITMPELTETEGKLKAKRQELHDIFEGAKNEQGELDHTKVKGYSTGTELAEAVRSLNDEVDDLSRKAEELRSIRKGAENAEAREEALESGDGATKRDDAPEPVKSIGQAFVEAKAYEQKGVEIDLDVELKTLFSTSAGWAPETTRGPRLVLDEQRPIQVVDLIPQTTTTQTAVTYMEETTFTNNAAEVAEGEAKPEGALALTEQSSTVRKIAVWLPVTDEQLEDVPRIEAYLNNRLPFMVQQRLDLQIISGNGTAPNLSGILDHSIQTQAKGADPVPDAVYKAMTKVQVTGQAMPDAAVFHPNDWQDVRLLRTTDGIYIWGNPSEAGPQRIWGLRVAVVQAATENTAIVGDFGNFSELAIKKGITVETTNAHSDFFIYNKQAIRAEMRAAFLLYRPNAFCSVTGI